MMERKLLMIVIVVIVAIFGFVLYKAVMAGIEKVDQEVQKVFREIKDSSASEKVSQNSAVAKNDPDFGWSRLIKMKVTAYCLCEKCCGKWAHQKVRVTSIGDNAKIYDGVAADPKLLPYRTRLKIPEIGIKEVDDTGGGMRQSAKFGIYHLDVRMNSHEKARKWGVRWLDVEVL